MVQIEGTLGVKSFALSTLLSPPNKLLEPAQPKLQRIVCAQHCIPYSYKYNIFVLHNILHETRTGKAQEYLHDIHI